MRRGLGVVALLNAMGAAIQAARGNYGVMAVCLVVLFVTGGWFVAMSVAAAAKAGDEGFSRGEGDES